MSFMKVSMYCRNSVDRGGEREGAFLPSTCATYLMSTSSTDTYGLRVQVRIQNPFLDFSKEMQNPF